MAAASGASFTVQGMPIKRDALVLGAGVANEARKNLLLFADFNVDMRGGGQTGYALVAGLRWVW